MTSSWFSKMRLGSEIAGLAAARQGQEEERPRLVLAKFHKVSPLCTIIVGFTLPFASLVETEVAAATGRLSRAPARIWLGLPIQRLAARSSGQRLPRPKICRVNFQRESPCRTLTVFCVASVVAGSARRSCSGRTATTGATGCAGWTRKSGGADRGNTFGGAGTIIWP